MLTDEDLLQKLGDPPLAPLRDANVEQAKRSTGRNAGTDGIKELRIEIKKLTSGINELLQVFSKAHEDIKKEPVVELSEKMDKLIEQNEEIGRALLLILELHREHLPQIARHTRVSSELKLRRPTSQLFSDRSRLSRR